jgi:hypothetical protein
MLNVESTVLVNSFISFTAYDVRITAKNITIGKSIGPEATLKFCIWLLFVF